MATYIDIARAFYEEKPHLLEGMDGHSTDGLIQMLARDLVGYCVEKLQAPRTGITEEVPAGLKIEKAHISAAFYKKTTEKRLELLRKEVQELLTRTDSPHVQAAATKLRADRYERAFAQKLTESLPDQITAYLEKIDDEAARMASDPDWSKRGRQGLPLDFDDMVAVARSHESMAITEAHRGLEQALRYGANDADLTACDDATDAEKERNLLYWKDGPALAVHYTQKSDETVADVDERAKFIASRINYPFGLTRAESIQTMLSAIFLTHGTMPNGFVNAISEEVRDNVSVGVAFDARKIANAVNAAVMKKWGNAGPQGFDFVRVAAAAVAGTEEGQGCGWPGKVISALMQELGTDDAARLVSEALPLNERGRAPDKSSWVGTRWETYGEFVARQLRNDAAGAVGGSLTTGAASVDEGDILPQDADATLDFTLAAPQYERLRAAMPFACLHEFRNVLVNTETGKSADGFTRRSVLETNAFLKEFCSQKLGETLGTFRKLRRETAEGLRTEHFVRARVEGRAVEGYYSDRMPERITARFWQQSRDLAEAAGIRPGEDIPEPTEGSEPERWTIWRNRTYAGAEAAEVISSGEEVTWLTALQSETVAWNLDWLSTVGNVEVYEPRTRSAEERYSVLLAGGRLREAATRLRSLTAYASRLKKLEATLEAQIKIYLDSIEPGLPERELRQREALVLGTCLILDAFVPSGDSHV